jgi:uncharacterized repeat protein (TIGR03803 family)
MDASSNLYGTTSGIPHMPGTVFKLDPSGNLTLLQRFLFLGANGYDPVADLVIDASGNLYGTTLQGGFSDFENDAFAEGVAFKLDPSGKETVLHNFGLDSGDGASPSAGLVMDPWGNLYGTTQSGGSSGNGTVFKLDMSVPFSAFSAKLDIRSGHPPGFQLKANFTQGAGAEAIDPVTQPVKLIVGTYTVTIPAGSFRALKTRAYLFDGAINGTALQALIMQTEAKSYLVDVDASCVDLTASSNPVPVSLYIGQNNGTTEVTANFEGRATILTSSCR